MLSAKQLIAGIVLIIVVGAGTFVYRNMMERPLAPGGNEPVACTMEAKLCPDGSGVGRQGPTCEFAACPPPNMEISSARIAFVLPTGYTDGVQQPGVDGLLDGMLDFYEKPSLSPSADHYLTIYSHPIPAGKTADQVILANTRYQPADMQAENFSRFSTKTIGGHAFRSTVIERFEGQIMSSYFLAREGDVLRFDIIERDVTEWMEPNLVVESLPEHKALLGLLATLTLY